MHAHIKQRRENEGITVTLLIPSPSHRQANQQQRYETKPAKSALSQHRKTTMIYTQCGLSIDKIPEAVDAKSEYIDSTISSTFKLLTESPKQISRLCA